MDKESILEYIDDNYQELIDEFARVNEQEFYEFCENEAINHFASKIDEAKERE